MNESYILLKLLTLLFKKHRKIKYKVKKVIRFLKWMVIWGFVLYMTILIK